MHNDCINGDNRLSILFLDKCMNSIIIVIDVGMHELKKIDYETCYYKKGDK